MMSPPLNLNECGRVWNSEWIRPYESLWGICQRYKQVNALTDTQIIRDLGEKRNTSYVVTFSKEYGIYAKKGLDKVDFSPIFIIPENHFRSIHPVINTFPIQKYATPNIIEHKLQYCPICLETHGFHSYLHQFAGLENCPWHPDQKMLKFQDMYYKIIAEEQYAFGNDEPDDSMPPLPTYTPFQNTIDPVIVPFKNIIMLFNTFPESDMLSYLTNVRDDFKIVAETEEEMLNNYEATRKHILKYIHHENLNNHHLSEDEDNTEDNYDIPYFCRYDNTFFTDAFIHVWICEQLSIYSKEEKLRYMMLLGADSGNRRPKILPNRNLVAVLRCSRAITQAISYFYIDSLDYIYHTNSLDYSGYNNRLHLDIYSHITEKIFKSEIFEQQRDTDPGLCYLWTMIASDYLTEILKQIQVDPYVKDLTGIREPNYILAQLDDGRWGYYKFVW